MLKKSIRPVIQTVFLLGTTTWVSVWGIGMIPFDKWIASQFWYVMAFRATQVLFSLVVVRLIRPSTMNRFTFKIEKRRLLVCLGIIATLVLKDVVSPPYSEFSWLEIFGALVFTMAIGVDEEIFSRLLIFGYFERFGVWVAAAISSIHFGLLHFSNFAWGGQALAYTSAQVVNAASFGFLCCGLMLYTGSIWIPILLHGLSDYSFQFMTSSEVHSMGQSSVDWLGLGINVFLFCGIGVLLIAATKPRQIYAEALMKEVTQVTPA